MEGRRERGRVVSLIRAWRRELVVVREVLDEEEMKERRSVCSRFIEI